MLDQNTDRMWFVIGAVIVGAAIIFIANGTLPTLFASVSDSFEESANKGTEVIENMEIKGTDSLLGYTVHKFKRIDLYEDGVLRDNPTSNWFSTIGSIPVTEGRSYTYAAKNNGTLAAPLVGFYDINDQYLGYLNSPGHQQAGVDFIAPEGTAYIMVGAGDTDHARYEGLLSEGKSENPIEDWVLIRR